MGKELAVDGVVGKDCIFRFSAAISASMETGSTAPTSTESSPS